jgi:hypothetical protein
MKTQFRINGKIFNPFKKLVIGLFLLSSFFFLFYSIGGHDGLVGIEKSVRNWMLGFMEENLAKAFSALVCLPISIYMVYAAVSGTYRIFTFNQYNPVFEENTPGGVRVKGCDSYANINRALSYRESKMCGMSPEQAAELYVSSSKIESLYTGYNNGPETLRTLSFIESRLAGMSSDRALNYLAHKL